MKHPSTSFIPNLKVVLIFGLLEIVTKQQSKIRTDHGNQYERQAAKKSGERTHQQWWHSSFCVFCNMAYSRFIGHNMAMFFPGAMEFAAVVGLMLAFPLQPAC
ncbi:MAG: hypothetical protein P8P36_03750 [Akkermansiaceae bacterium]|nr:hypothetical protein [Akkermansiaceae bacterium]